MSTPKIFISATRDPADAAWQRDLWVAYAKLADHAEKANQPAEARNWWKKTLDTLAAMKQRGLHLSPEDEGFFERLHKAIEN